MISYEWTLEIIEDTDIVDSTFSDTLDFDRAELIGNDLGLVRNEGNDNAGLEDRYWAYVKGGKLPEYFTNAMGESINIKVPQRFHAELAKYLTVAPC